MKKALTTIFIFSSSIILSSCDKKSKNEDNLNNSEDAVKLIKKTASHSKTPIPEVSKTVKGKVGSIEYGKDGYTAKILTLKEEIYYATVSHANLLDQKQYRTFKVGEEV